jgi:hypothetical protein
VLRSDILRRPTVNGFSLSFAFFLDFVDSFRSENRMRQHANAQNAVPNNQRQIPATTDIQTSNNNISETTDISNPNRIKTTKPKDQRDAKQKRNEWRITRMIFAIFLSFICCYLPITITKVLDKDVNWPVLHIIGYVMIYLRFAANFCDKISIVV